MTSDNTESRVPPVWDENYRHASFCAFVYVIDLERDSLSRKYDGIQCILAVDDTASVNLYLDYRKEIDYLQYSLTHAVRQLYMNRKTTTIKVLLSTQRRLEITLGSEEQCQAVYDQLLKIKDKPADTDGFPRHKPKAGLLKPDPTSAYLTANDIPTEFPIQRPNTATLSMPSKRAMTQRPLAALEQIKKKSRLLEREAVLDSFHQFRESREPIPSCSPAPQSTPNRWDFPDSPVYKNGKIMTPNTSNSLRQAINQFERFGRVAPLDPLPMKRPQFHAVIPTTRVLRSLSDKSKRYGRDIATKGSRHERSSSSKCIYAVLQALFWLNPVVADLQETYWLQLSEAQTWLFRSLVDALSPHSKDASQILAEEVISSYIVKSPNGSLGDEEDDAHGFLNDCLNQVRREFQERRVDADYPLSRLFECDIDHILICKNCAHESIQTEHQQIFRLELPVANSNRSIQQTASISSLFPQFFESQHIAFECDMCQSESAMVHRSISKLPKVLVISLKRFTRRPSHGYSMNRSRVDIDETLDFAQFCSPKAFASTALGASRTRYSNDNGFHDNPHIPSDSFPSSSSSRFSSISPRRQDYQEYPISSSTSQDYDNTNAYGLLTHSSATNPIELLSDDEDIYDLSLSQAHSFYEEPSEDEQYRWAIEESLRTSQSNSQESNLDKDECPSQDFADNLSSGRHLDMEGSRNNKDTDNDVRNNVGHSRCDNDVKPILDPDSAKSNDKSENKSNIEEGIVVISDDEDEEVKAAIVASLLPADTLSSTDDKLREKENKEMEEAIRRSLIDQEDNKENISPEKNVGKKEKKDKSVSVKTQQKEIPAPARLQRADTIDGDGSLAASRDVSEWLQSCSQPLPQSCQQQHHARFPSGASTSTTDNNSGQQFYPRSTLTIDEPDGYQSVRTTKESKGKEKEKEYKKGKGKERASDKTQMKCEVSDQGLFRLQAAISHTGLTSATSEGYYICDRRGADGIWRCHDGRKRTRIGPISDLSRHRGRSGYLFFYVSCRPE